MLKKMLKKGGSEGITEQHIDEYIENVYSVQEEVYKEYFQKLSELRKTNNDILDRPVNHDSRFGFDDY